MRYTSKDYELTGIVMHMESLAFGKMETYLYVKPNVMVKLCDPDRKITDNDFNDYDSKRVNVYGHETIPEEPEFMNDNYSPESLYVHKIEIAK